MSTDKFVNRHNGPRASEVKEMLKKIGPDLSILGQQA